MNVKTFTTILERLFGVLLLFAGLNKVFLFFPLPEKTGFALRFLDTLEATGYVMPIVTTTILATGLALLSRRFVSLAAVCLFPVALNIFLFHLMHDRSGLAIAIVVLGGNLALIFRRLPTYKNLLKGRD